MKSLHAEGTATSNPGLALNAYNSMLLPSYRAH